MDNNDDHLDGENEDEQDENEKQDKDYYDKQLILACKKGDLELAKKSLDKKPAAVNFEDKKKMRWSAIVWASCKNYLDIVKLLLQRGAADIYLQIPGKELDTKYKNPRKCTLGQINESVYPTPLQWASFKGNIQIVWNLIKSGLRWEDIDQFGNNCVHLAASGGNLQVFQCYLMMGVDIEGRNSRNHDVSDLSTSKEISKLINDIRRAQQCTKCESELKDLQKHWCQTCKQIYCQNCFKIEWVWENHESAEKERIDGKCINCWGNIGKHTQQLEQKIKDYQHGPLTQKLNEIQKLNIEIDKKLFHSAIVFQEKLKTQNIILEFIDSLKIVENYKTILKSVNIIKEMKEDAKQRNVIIDQNVIEIADGQIDRLVSERNLRFELDNLDVGQCNPDEVKNLQELMDIAVQKGVAQNYMNDAEALKLKMAKSIQTKDICKLFQEYPIRQDYTPPIEIDPKTKKLIDPETKKFVDIKLLLAPKKKKKKKDLKFNIPEWANEIPHMEEQIKTIETLLKSAQELDFTKEFLDSCTEQISRMKKELKHRKALKKEEEIIADLKAAQKKKK